MVIVGKVREWTKRAVSKAVAPDWVPRVRIPVLPLWERVRLYGESPPGALVERVPGGAFVCPSWLSAECELGARLADELT